MIFEYLLIFGGFGAFGVAGWQLRGIREDVLRRRELAYLKATYATEHEAQALRAVRRTPGARARQSDADVSSTRSAYHRKGSSN